MDHTERDVEAYLAVGLTAYLHPKAPGSESTRIKTLVRGWQKGHYILIETPQGDGKLPIFSEGRPCTIRFLHEGYACGFESYVVESGRIGGLGYGRLTWPRQVETVRVRKQDRLPTAIPCVVKLVTGDQYNAVIDDLSADGCCVRGEMASPPSNGEELFLSFTLPGSSPVSDVRAVVRRVHLAGAATVLGCQFVEGEDAARQDISFYVVTATERSRSGLAESRRALIIDGNESSASALCRALQDLQLETFVASGLVDGFYRMRMISPLAVFIGYEQKEIPAVQICRIVKGTKGFENTAVLVYGSDSMAVHDEALEAGADAYFSSASKATGVRAALARFAPTPPAK